MPPDSPPHSAPRSPIRQIPVILLTGFLGSGKTTLLRSLLAAPAWASTAVLVNELGAVGLDHHLVWGASGTMLVLENGCICCSISDDLLGMLEDLFWKRLHRAIPHFDRVVIETTGLANPGPIIRALFEHRLVAERYCLESVICTVDAVFGAQQLAQHPEALAQASAADLIVLTKADLMPDGATKTLETQLRGLNPLADLEHGTAGVLPLACMQDLATSTGRRTLHAAHLQQALHAGAPADADPDATADVSALPQQLVFHHRVHATVIRFEQPWDRTALQRALEAVTARHGERVLRIKGLVRAVGEHPPLVVQVVQSMIFPFEATSLSGERTGDDANALVCITLGVPAAELRACFAVAA